MGKERFKHMGAAALASLSLVAGSHSSPDLSGCNTTNRIQVPEYPNAEVSEYVYVAGAPDKKPFAKKRYDEATYFGCNFGYKDDEDGCDPRLEKQVPECNFVSKHEKGQVVLRENYLALVPRQQPLGGADCEKQGVIYYSANATEWLREEQYNGKGWIKTVLEVTNPENGKKVNVRPIDWGPSCKIQFRDQEAKFDLSRAAYDIIKSDGSFPVLVKRVPDTTPLGKVNADK